MKQYKIVYHIVKKSMKTHQLRWLDFGWIASAATARKSVILGARVLSLPKFIDFNTKPIIFNAKCTILNAEFIIFNAELYT